MAGKMFEQIIEKLNPYHGSDGRFTTADSAASFTYKPGASTAHDNAIAREKERTGSAKGFKGTLYHGSPATDIEEFDMSLAGRNTSSGEKLLFFTDSKQMADDFSYERLDGSSKFMQRRGKKGRVYEVDVEIKKPLDLRDLSEKDIKNLMKLDVDGILTREIVVELSGKNNQLLKTYLDLTAESLKGLGYDGLIAHTGKAGHNSIEYAVVDSKQARIRKGVAKSFAEILKENPYHDPSNGRFTTASGGGSGGNTDYQGKKFNRAQGSGKTVDVMAAEVEKLPEKVKAANPEAIEQIKNAAGNPDAKIKIYRATIGDTINSGDWVFLDRSLADKWTRTAFGSPKPGCKVLTKEVSAKEVDWTGKNLEFAFKPEEVAKGNPYHDPSNGRFTTGPGGGGGAWAESMEAEKASVMAMKPAKRAMYVLDHDGETYDNCVAAMQNGETEALVNNYFAVMAANGDPTPTKPVSDQLDGQIRQDVEGSKKYSGYEEARKEYIKDMSGLDDDQAQATMKEFQKWFGGSWDDADTATLDKYIEEDHAFEGTMYRGMKFDHDGFDAFMKDIGPGAQIRMQRNSSWSSDEEVARSFGAHIYNDVDTVMITCVKNRTSAPVAHLSTAGESEVLAHSKASWTVLHSEVVQWPSGAKKAYLTVVETGE